MYNTIKNEIKNAMKDKDTNKRDVLKQVVDKAKAQVKANNPHDTCETIADDVILAAINKEVKQLNQTITALAGKETTPLYISSTAKLAILTNYLPKQMSEDEVYNAVADLLKDKSNLSFGEKMKLVMAELKGKADNNIIKNAVQKL